VGMANKHMRYRYSRAFIVEGLLAREGQEIVLSDQPDERRKFVLTGTPDSLLADADKTTAAGLIVTSRFSVVEAPPPPPVNVIVDEIRSERKKLLNQRMVFVCQFEGTAASVEGAPVAAPSKTLASASRSGESNGFARFISSVSERSELTPPN
jgi:hypothetical protein